MWRIYKEGQGKWARGLMVFVIMIAVVFGLSELHSFLKPRPHWSIFGVDWRFLVHVPLLIVTGYFCLWLFNRPQTADFLIETEGELKNKVTWPSRKEEVNASIVVIVTVLILSAIIFVVDNGFRYLSHGVVYDAAAAEEEPDGNSEADS